MTSIRIFDPSGSITLPELPELPVGVLAVGVAELLQQAADLPQPCYITISQTQSVSLQFTPEQASAQAITRWAHRFGTVATSQPGHCDGKDGTWYRARFDYYGIAVTAYAHILAGPAS